MIQPPTKKTTEKTESNLRGARMVILSLAVMTVGGGMMLFVYAFSKAQQSFSKAEQACESATLNVAAEGTITAAVPVGERELVLTLTQGDGSVKMLRVDSCSGEIASERVITLGAPAGSETP